MVNLELETDEGIILQSKEIEFFGDIDNETDIMELILTNKNLICVDDKGWFKSDIVIEKIPIKSIKIVNNKPQIMETVSNIGDPAFQILLNNGQRKQIIFDRSDKKEIKRWIGSIKNVINGINEVYDINVDNATPTVVEAEDRKTTTAAEKIENAKKAAPPEDTSKTSKRKSWIGGLAGTLGSLDIQSAVEKVQAKIAEFPEQMAEKLENLSYNDTATEEIIPEQPLVQQASSENSNAKHIFCSNCGTKLNDGAKFCHGCGAAVGTVSQVSEQIAPPIPPESFQNNSTERQQEFVGKILKCPNCGCVINETTAICPDCGMQITGRSAVRSVQAFKSELMNLESRRIGGIKGMLLGQTIMVDPIDIKKIALIQNFPIPNTVDDIIEFMLLAIANINVGLSKGKWNKRAPTTETAYTIKRTISNAWVAKMIQAYQKAELTLSNDPTFEKIQRLYFNIANELKIKVNK